MGALTSSAVPTAIATNPRFLFNLSPSSLLANPG